jgi:hypothetical protein
MTKRRPRVASGRRRMYDRIRRASGSDQDEAINGERWVQWYVTACPVLAEEKGRRIFERPACCEGADRSRVRGRGRSLGNRDLGELILWEHWVPGLTNSADFD